MIEIVGLNDFNIDVAMAPPTQDLLIPLESGGNPIASEGGFFWDFGMDWIDASTADMWGTADSVPVTFFNEMSVSGFGADTDVMSVTVAGVTQTWYTARDHLEGNETIMITYSAMLDGVERQGGTIVMVASASGVDTYSSTPDGTTTFVGHKDYVDSN